MNENCVYLEYEKLYISMNLWSLVRRQSLNHQLIKSNVCSVMDKMIVSVLFLTRAGVRVAAVGAVAIAAMANPAVVGAIHVAVVVYDFAVLVSFLRRRLRWLTVLWLLWLL